MSSSIHTAAFTEDSTVVCKALKRVRRPGGAARSGTLFAPEWRVDDAPVSTLVFGTETVLCFGAKKSNFNDQKYSMGAVLPRRGDAIARVRQVHEALRACVHAQPETVMYAHMLRKNLPAKAPADKKTPDELYDWIDAQCKALDAEALEALRAQLRPQIDELMPFEKPAASPLNPNKYGGGVVAASNRAGCDDYVLNLNVPTDKSDGAVVGLAVFAKVDDVALTADAVMSAVVDCAVYDARLYVEANSWVWMPPGGETFGMRFGVVQINKTSARTPTKLDFDDAPPTLTSSAQELKCSALNRVSRETGTGMLFAPEWTIDGTPVTDIVFATERVTCFGVKKSNFNDQKYSMGAVLPRAGDASARLQQVHAALRAYVHAQPETVMYAHMLRNNLPAKAPTDKKTLDDLVTWLDQQCKALDAEALEALRAQLRPQIDELMPFEKPAASPLNPNKYGGGVVAASAREDSNDYILNLNVGVDKTGCISVPVKLDGAVVDQAADEVMDVAVMTASLYVKANNWLWMPPGGETFGQKFAVAQINKCSKRPLESEVRDFDEK